MEYICLGKVKNLYIYNKALYLLPKIKTVDEYEIEKITIDTKNSEETGDIVSGLKDICLGKVKYLLIYNKALYLLPKIKPVEEHEVYYIIIDTKNSDLTLEIVKDMEYISLGKVKRLLIYNKALYLLPKIKPVKVHEVDHIIINTKSSDLSLNTVKYMEDICLGKVKYLRIYRKALYLMPKIKLGKEHEVDQVSIDTEDSEVTLDTVSDMADICIGKVNKLYIYNKALYLLRKIKLTNTYPMKELIINKYQFEETEMSFVNDFRESYSGMIKKINIFEKNNKVYSYEDKNE
eukprot:GHVP01057457.1.p1 GENE.GHVP01057457.1~~GHVP01057457.1.p1  ORF type:complete len:291 (-),score=33.32 GHVP01057457.1:341-1213(-)